MQICTLTQTDNHASIPPLSFYRPDALPATKPTASKHWRQQYYHQHYHQDTSSVSFTAKQDLNIKNDAETTSMIIHLDLKNNFVRLLNNFRIIKNYNAQWKIEKLKLLWSYNILAIKRVTKNYQIQRIQLPQNSQSKSKWEKILIEINSFHMPWNGWTDAGKANGQLLWQCLKTSANISWTTSKLRNYYLMASFPEQLG